jgi:hypothetical protein
MATKKKKPAKAAPKKRSAKKVAPKRAAPKKVAPKKPAPKKPAPKKPAPKKPAPKKAAPKKPAPKKVAPKKAAPKAAAPKKVAAPKAERLSKFPAVLEELVSWVNEGRAGNLDFEMYGSFNEQYKPSDWTRNPASDDELFTFGMDGSGSQVAIWRRDADVALDDLPVVFLGSEGEVRPLATSLPAFLHLVASGLGPAEIAFGSGDEPTANDAMLEWVRETYSGRAFPDPQAILDEAAEALAGFEAHMMSSTKA